MSEQELSVLAERAVLAAMGRQHAKEFTMVDRLEAIDMVDRKLASVGDILSPTALKRLAKKMAWSAVWAGDVPALSNTRRPI